MRVRTLVSLVLLVLLVLPFLFVGAIEVVEDALVVHTEQTLLAEAVVIGELYRQSLDPDAELEAPRPGQDPYAPFTPRLAFDAKILEPSSRGPQVRTSSGVSRLSTVLARSVVRNLSGPRVLDRQGVVVASSSTVTGYTLIHLTEVKAALAGRYEPVLRRRYSDEPAPPRASISRAGTFRVSIAIPIFSDPRAQLGHGEVIGVVYNNRTPLDVDTALWLWRDRFVNPAVATAVLTIALAMLLTLAISLPIGRLQRSAERVARGDPEAIIQTGRLAPTEIQDLASSLSKMRGQLESRADYIREFAANAAHELKTPITSLRGAAELLMEDGDGMEPERRQRFLQNVRADALRMDELVGRILDLARIESTHPVKEEIDLFAFLEATAERYRRRGASLRLTLEGEKRIRYAPQHLDSLVTNLVDNAVRHGGGEPIDLIWRSGVLTIRDHGPPLPAGALDRVFERFYSTARNQGGTGLGLAIVKAIAEAHGGSVKATVEAKGASFSVVIPEA